MYGKIVLPGFRRSRPASRAVVFPRQPVGLHALITSAGHEIRTERSYRFQGLRRGRAEFALLQYTLAGQGEMTFEGQAFTPTPGAAMLLHFPHDNSYGVADGRRWEFVYLCLCGGEIMRIWRWAVARLGPLPMLSPDSPLALALARVVRDVLDGRLTTPWQASAWAYEIAMCLLELVFSQDSAPNHLRPPALEAAIAMCRDNLDRPIGVQDLAQAAGLSRSYFTRLFTACEGVTPGEFLLRQRMRQAVRLLQTTDEPVKRIAVRCGFADPAYFCKVFQKTYSVSPGGFRRSGMY